MLEISGALAGARATVEAIKLGIEARDDAKVKAALVDLQAKLVEAMSTALSLVEKNAALQAALSEAQREKADIQRKVEERASYTLHEIAPGTFVYASQPGSGGRQEPQHYLCQACYDKGTKSILRRIDQTTMGASWTCVQNSAHGFWI